MYVESGSTEALSNSRGSTKTPPSSSGSGNLKSMKTTVSDQRLSRVEILKKSKMCADESVLKSPHDVKVTGEPMMP
ncbi:hypothetical protein TNCV_2184261 [Trichonephila clavipes]|nr:hypothetical protein TNCV_2184261 [Trichonephila clavipes]